MSEMQEQLEAFHVMESSASQFRASPYACAIIWGKSLNFPKPLFSPSMQSEVIINWTLNEIMYLKHLEGGMTSAGPQDTVVLQSLTTLWAKVQGGGLLAERAVWAQAKEATKIAGSEPTRSGKGKQGERSGSRSGM